MFSIVLFILYCFAFIFIIHRITKKTVYHFSFGQISAIFLFKIALGCIYGFIFLKYYHGDDTWNFFNDSLGESKKLIHHTGIFFKDIFQPERVRDAVGAGEAIRLYLDHLEYSVMVKLLAVFNIFSGGNYYIDVLFFNFATCWGQFMLFKLLMLIIPDKKNMLMVAVFFIPSISFWMSGIRGEALLFLFMMMLIYGISRLADRKRIIYIIGIVTGIVGLIIFRAPFLFVLMPSLIAFIISKKGKKKPAYYFTVVYAVCIGSFFLSIIISPNANLATPITKQQAAFFALHGNTRFLLDTLKPAAGSFFQIFPAAATNVFVRPFIWEAKGALQWISAIEVVCSWILVGLLLFDPTRNAKRVFREPLLLLFLFYGISQMLLIGYIVPFPGAIVRYKMIPELFLLILFLTAINLPINYKNK